ncbi:cytochrome P450, partial [Stereum hirsutum FP-91666 SS1]|uniref:cytochrome P450 n=1 Tax=Stereum hirsutum (strain FP-91666) TaxID=721885 RepID=UPI0004449B11
LHNFRVRSDYAACIIVFACLALIVVNMASVSANALYSPLSPLFFVVAAASSACVCTVLYRLSPLHPLASYPGPRIWWISNLKLVHVSLTGRRHLVIDELHAKYGPYVRIGPNSVSINSPSATVIYGANLHMEKSDSYSTPGHIKSVSLFFKQASRETHSDRKKIWSRAFTGNAVAQYMPLLERRTWQLTTCLESRQARSPTGTVNLHEALCHWAYDLMGDVVFGGCNSLELMKNGDPRELVEGGKEATILVDSLGQAPWLMDILWHLPAGGAMLRLRDVAAELMRKRVVSTRTTEIRDLTSYLLEGDATGEPIPHRDLEVEAVVAMQGGKMCSLHLPLDAHYSASCYRF